MSLTPPQFLRLSVSKVENMLVIACPCLFFLYNCSSWYSSDYWAWFVTTDVFAYFFYFMRSFRACYMVWGSSCTVTVEDRTVTPRCFIVGHFNLEMECCLFGIYPISFFFHIPYKILNSSQHKKLDNTNVVTKFTCQQTWFPQVTPGNLHFHQPYME